MVNDLIIIGAGPAGMTAGIYAKERKLNTIILESYIAGGQISRLYPKKYIDDYPGMPHVIAQDFVKELYKQLSSFGLGIMTDNPVESFKEIENKIFIVTSKNVEYQTKSILLAVGIGLCKAQTLNIPGEDLSGVYHIFPEISDIQGKKVMIIGGGETAFEGGINALNQGAKDVILIHRKDQFRAIDSAVEAYYKKGGQVLTPYELIKINQNDTGLTAHIKNCQTQIVQNLDTNIICIHIGYLSDSSLMEKWGILVNNRAVLIDKNMQTSIPGIFACGDVTIPQGEFRRITTAVGQAATAVHGVYKYLRNPYWK